MPISFNNALTHLECQLWSLAQVMAQCQLCNKPLPEPMITNSCATNITSLGQNELTHCGLVTPYGGRDLGQHWFRQWFVAWRHQAITWTNVDLSSQRSSDVHLREISLEISQPSVTKISLKIIFLRFYWNLPGTNELTHLQPNKNTWALCRNRSIST